MVELLLSWGTSSMAKDGSGRMPLSCAAYNGHLEAVKLLFEEGSTDVELKDNKG